MIKRVYFKQFSLASVVISEAFCLDVAQGRMNGALNETRIHSCSFATKLANHYTTRPSLA